MKQFEFYINKFEYLNKIEDIDVNFIPPILRRRMSTLYKAILTVLNKVYSEEIQNVIFSSKCFK